MGRLDDKICIITGAARGQGEAEARLFAAEGATVWLTDVLDDEGKAVASDMGGTYRHLDVRDEAAWSTIVEEIVDTYGRVDVLVNNAGIYSRGRHFEISVDDFNQVMDINCTGVFLGMRAVSPHMRSAGQGSIVNISSVAGMLRAGIGSHAYTVAKHGVVGLTRSTALELAEYNIRVNAVCPGYIATGLSAGRSKSEIDETEMAERLDKARGWGGDAQAMNRMGEPEDIAAAVAWLASDDSAWVTGTEQVVDGGLLNGRAWRKLPKAITQDRPVRLYAPGTYE
ncbi:UNVERIFIED_CONTAM: hypothetical protein GTU68_003583 [Idotea baltica]|nr:hypothetical protein [Idotea baltica]